jgi:hypothetical protein
MTIAEIPQPHFQSLARTFRDCADQNVLQGDSCAFGGRRPGEIGQHPLHEHKLGAGISLTARGGAAHHDASPLLACRA